MNALNEKLTAGEHFADVNGVRLYYTVTGNGPVCIMPSPGWGAQAELYVNSLKPFEKHFTMVYYDTRKTGLSTGPDDYTKYTDQDLVDDMEAFRAHLGVEKIWLAGHSGGGFQVLNYATQYISHVNGILAIAAMARYDDEHTKEMMHILETVKAAPEYANAKQILFGANGPSDATPEDIVNSLLPLYFSNQSLLATLPRLKVSGQVFVYTNQSKLFHSKNLLEDLHKINVPVWVVVGAEDFICGPESEAKRIHARIPSSELVIIEGVGHMSWVEKPDLFFAAFEQWIKKQGL